MCGNFDTQDLGVHETQAPRWLTALALAVVTGFVGLCVMAAVMDCQETARRSAMEARQ